MIWIIWILLWVLAGIPAVSILTHQIRKHKRGSVKQGDSWHDRYSSTPLWQGVVKLIMAPIVGGLLVLTNLPDAFTLWIWLGWIIAWLLIESLAVNAATAVSVVTVVLLIALIVGGIIVGVFASYNNAAYFNQYVQTKSGMPFQSEIPDNMVRLTTDVLATSMITQRLNYSNIDILSTRITMYQGRLVWVVTTGPHGGWGLTYYADRLFIIDANDPTAPPVIVNQEFRVAEGLDWNPVFGAWGNIHALGYYTIGTENSYGRVYPTQDPEGNWVSVLTSFTPTPMGVRVNPTVYIVSTDGQVLQRYDSNKVPDWVTQSYDETGFLAGGIGDWGNHRRQNPGEPTASIDFWAPGFLWIPPSQGRVEMTQDTRYIYDPDLKEVVGIIQVNPIRANGDQALEGIFKATHEGIYYYPMGDNHFISGNAAGNAVLTTVGKASQGEYSTDSELLYPVQVGTVTKWAYFVPIYAQSSSSSSSNQILLKGLAIVDATDQNNVVYSMTTSGLNGANLVRTVKAQFAALFGVHTTTQATNTTSIMVTITGINTYIQNGNTQWYIQAAYGNQTVTLWADASALQRDTIGRLLTLKVGDTVTVTVDSTYNIVSIS